MKKLLILPFLSVFLFGCTNGVPASPFSSSVDLSQEEEKLNSIRGNFSEFGIFDVQELQNRDGVCYMQNSPIPYEGMAVNSFYKDGAWESVFVYTGGEITSVHSFNKNGTPAIEMLVKEKEGVSKEKPNCKKIPVATPAFRDICNLIALDGKVKRKEFDDTFKYTQDMEEIFILDKAGMLSSIKESLGGWGSTSSYTSYKKNKNLFADKTLCHIKNTGDEVIITVEGYDRDKIEGHETDIKVEQSNFSLKKTEFIGQRNFNYPDGKDFIIIDSKATMKEEFKPLVIDTKAKHFYKNGNQKSIYEEWKKGSSDDQDFNKKVFSKELSEDGILIEEMKVNSYKEKGEGYFIKSLPNILTAENTEGSKICKYEGKGDENGEEYIRTEFYDLEMTHIAKKEVSHPYSQECFSPNGEIIECDSHENFKGRCNPNL